MNARNLHCQLSFIYSLDKEVIKGKYIFQNRKGCHELSAEGKDAVGVAKRKDLKSLKKFQTERKIAQIQNLIRTEI